LASTAPVPAALVKGWVRTRRDTKDFSFIEVNDGSCLSNLQVIAVQTLNNYAEIRKLTTGSAIAVQGALLASQGKGQRWELHADQVDIVQIAPDSYPLQKKRHSDEFLRTIAHLRPRTNKYGATFRIRSELSFAIHQFFRERGFNMFTPPFSPVRIARAPANCFGSPLSNRDRGRSTRIFLARRPI
jgi:asparaginyl-tRNA synthetase